MDDVISTIARKGNFSTHMLASTAGSVDCEIIDLIQLVINGRKVTVQRWISQELRLLSKVLLQGVRVGLESL